MSETKKKASKVLRVLLIIAGVLLLLFAGSFVAFATLVGKAGDADLANFGAVIRYLAHNVKLLLQFDLNGGASIISIGLSSVLFAIAFLSFVYIIIGVFVAANKKRALVLFGVVLAVVVLAVYCVGAAGAYKYWAIIRNRYPYSEHKELMVPTYALIITGVGYAILAYVCYFLCIVEAFKGVKVEEAPVEAPEQKPEEKEAPLMDEPKEDEYVEDECEYITKKDMASLIREIIKEELGRTSAPQQGPLVVQYFGTMPAPEQKMEEPKKEEPVPEPVKEPEPEPQPEPEPEPVVEEVVPEPEVEEEPGPEVIPEPIVLEEPVVVTPEPVVEEVKEKKPIIRIPFQERMMNADEEMKKNYNELKNEIMSYGVNSRVSSSGDAFRLHRKTYVKLTIAGLSLKLYFALNPEDYKDSPIPVQDAGHKGIYAEIPLVFKVKSGLSMRRAKELIQTVMEQDGLEQGQVEDIDWVAKLSEVPSEEEPEEAPAEETPAIEAPKDETNN